jgi:hypothetical protein
MFGMANLRPEHTGVDVLLHAYKDIDFNARHAPRIKAYPGKYTEGRATVITVPTRDGVSAEVLGRATIRGKQLRAAVEFVERNWRTLILYWYNPDYGQEDLLADLVPPE